MPTSLSQGLSICTNESTSCAVSDSLLNQFDQVIYFDQQDYWSTIRPSIICFLIPDIYSDNHKTLSNLYCQLYMLKTTSPILRETIFQDSIILSVRDDLYFPDISSLTKALDLSMHLRQKPFFLTSVSIGIWYK